MFTYIFTAELPSTSQQFLASHDQMNMKLDWITDQKGYMH